MKIRVEPDGSMATIELEVGEQFAARTGAMIAMSPEIEVATGVRGGLIRGMLSKFRRREALLNNFRAVTSGEVVISTLIPGQVFTFELANDEFLIDGRAYLASSSSVRLEDSGGKHAGAGLTMKVSGSGWLALGILGGIREIELKPDEREVVDSGYLVAAGLGVDCRIKRVGPWTTTLVGKEGLVVELTGPGTVYLQTHCPDALVDWLTVRMPPGGFFPWLFSRRRRS